MYTNLHLISAAYCKNVEVDYQPDGQTSFLNEGKMERCFIMHTKLSVSFVEDRIITKSDISAGVMQYFSEFPKIDYNITGVNGNVKEITDMAKSKS